MQGYYKCKKCNIVIDVMTTSRNSESYTIKVKIPFCPHCKGELEEIEYDEFLQAKPKTFLRLIRTFNFRHVGDRDIKMKVKFL